MWSRRCGSKCPCWSVVVRGSMATTCATQAHRSSPLAVDFWEDAGNPRRPSPPAGLRGQGDGAPIHENSRVRGAIPEPSSGPGHTHVPRTIIPPEWAGRVRPGLRKGRRGDGRRDSPSSRFLKSAGAERRGESLPDNGKTVLCSMGDSRPLRSPRQACGGAWLSEAARSCGRFRRPRGPHRRRPFPAIREAPHRRVLDAKAALSNPALQEFAKPAPWARIWAKPRFGRHV